MRNLFFSNIYVFFGIFALAIWIPSLFVESGTVFENTASMEIDLSQFNAITFVTYPVKLSKPKKIKRYLITLSSMLLTSPYSKLVISYSNVENNFDPYEELERLMKERFGEGRVALRYLDDRFNDKQDVSEENINDGQTLKYDVFLNDLYFKSVHSVSTKFVCFIDPDVAVDHFWYDTVFYICDEVLKSEYTDSVYITGQRISVPLNYSELKSFNYSKKYFFRNLQKMLKSQGNATCQPQAGTDYFVTTINDQFDNMPDLVMNDGGIGTMLVNALAEQKAFAVNMQLFAPVYMLRKPQKVTNSILKRAQTNYNEIELKMQSILKMRNIPNKIENNKVEGLGFTVELQESEYQSLISAEDVECEKEDDMPNIKIVEYTGAHFRDGKENFGREFDDEIMDGQEIP